MKNVNNKIWDLKIRKSVQKEFPGDPMMQELHELRLRKPFYKTKGGFRDLKKAGLMLRETPKSPYKIK